MSDRESSLPDDWFKKGDDDQQAVGILLKHGGKSSVAVLEFDESFEDFREISQKATAFYFLERYPFFSDELNREEVEETYIKSLKLIEKIENLEQSR